jgi:hypothetical protein
MRITSVTMPNIKVKPIEKALEALYDHCYNTAVHVMKMSNEIEDLKQKIQRLENQR